MSKEGLIGCLKTGENEENEENPILWIINIITINQGGGGARSIQLPRYLVFIYLLAIHISLV